MLERGSVEVGGEGGGEGGGDIVDCKVAPATEMLCNNARLKAMVDFEK